MRPAPPNWVKLQETRLHERLKMHLWRIATNSLPIKESIQKFAPILDPSCSLCDHQSETFIHLFWECPFARALWFSCSWGLKPASIQLSSISDLINTLIALPPELGLDSTLMEEFLISGTLVLDQIWKIRNLKLHGEGVVDIGKIMKDLKTHINEHLAALKVGSCTLNPPILL
jgi:hypothetical protein